MSTKNDITGDPIYSVPTEAYRDNFDTIFKGNSMIEKRNGWYWPKDDKHCFSAIFNEVFKIELMDEYVVKKECVIQAGGNCGVFAKEFAKTWSEVHTFEPDDINFECLDKNCPEENIHKYKAALGKNNDKIRVGQSADHEKNNCGAFQVLGDGDTPTLMIDELNLKPDLIYLDIEGYEIFALQGAEKTIKKYHPVIVIENKKLPLMYGVTEEEVIEYLVCTFGYEVKERVQRDVILV